MWWAVLIAVAIGLLLFALIWSRGRGEPDFYLPGEAPPTSEAGDYTPLPVPAPAGEDRGETGDVAPGDAPAEGDNAAIIEPEPARIEETGPPLPAAPESAQPMASNAPTVQPVPLAGSTPSPRYPARALRRGQTGTVTLRVRVGVDGVPEAVTVAQGSGSRDLDRAAVNAVRGWRFEPATQDGRPTTGVVNVPINFNRGR